MKIMKCVLSVLCSVVWLCSCGGNTAAVEGLTGKVTMDGYEGRYVFLETTDGSAVKVDSTTVTDGKFAFTFNDSVPQVYTLVLAASDDDQYPITLPVVSEKGHVKVSMGELVLTSGTPLNDELQDFLLAVSNFYDKALQQEKPDLQKIAADFSKLVEGAIMGNVNTPVGVYIYRAYGDKLTEPQKAQIMLRGGESFRQAVNQ